MTQGARNKVLPHRRGAAPVGARRLSFGRSLLMDRGQASDIERHAEDIRYTKRRLNEIYVHHTGRTYEEVEKTLDRDHFMSAEESKAWGIVDHVYDRREQAEDDGVKTPGS